MAEKVLIATPEATEFIKALARRMGRDESFVLRTALGMLTLALDAKDQGMPVGIAPSANVLDTEFTDF